jgi:hypothetical protein
MFIIDNIELSKQWSIDMKCIGQVSVDVDRYRQQFHVQLKSTRLTFTYEYIDRIGSIITRTIDDDRKHDTVRSMYTIGVHHMHGQTFIKTLRINAIIHNCTRLRLFVRFRRRT